MSDDLQRFGVRNDGSFGLKKYGKYVHVKDIADMRLENLELDQWRIVSKKCIRELKREIQELERR